MALYDTICYICDMMNDMMHVIGYIMYDMMYGTIRCVMLHVIQHVALCTLD